MGSALQYRMLVATGSPGPRVIAGLTASNLLVFAVVLALPVLALPAVVRGGVQHDLLNAAVVGLAVFVVLYFWSPARWTPSPGSVVQHTGGTGSPALNGTGNSVVVNGAPPR